MNFFHWAPVLSRSWVVASWKWKLQLSYCCLFRLIQVELDLILKEVASLIGLTSYPYRIYLFGIGCISAGSNSIHFQANLVQTSMDRRSAVHDISPFRIKLSVPCFILWWFRNLSFCTITGEGPNFFCSHPLARLETQWRQISRYQDTPAHYISFLGTKENETIYKEIK